MHIIKQAFDVPEVTQIIFEFKTSDLTCEEITETERLVLKSTATTPVDVEDALMAIASLYLATKNKPNRSKKHG